MSRRYVTHVRGVRIIHYQPRVIRPTGIPPYYAVIRCGGPYRYNQSHLKRSRDIFAVTCLRCLTLWVKDHKKTK